MRQTVIHDSEAFKLTSYGCGTAYALENKRTNKSILVQGDDAVTFQQAYIAHEALCDDGRTDTALTLLYHDYQDIAE